MVAKTSDKDSIICDSVTEMGKEAVVKEVRLEPGWLMKDVRKAASRLDEWAQRVARTDSLHRAERHEPKVTVAEDGTRDGESARRFD